MGKLNTYEIILPPGILSSSGSSWDINSKEDTAVVDSHTLISVPIDNDIDIPGGLSYGLNLIDD